MYTKADFEALPVLHQGQYDNLYYSHGGVKVWLSRLDETPNLVTIEIWSPEKSSWVTVAEYEAL